MGAFSPFGIAYPSRVPASIANHGGCHVVYRHADLANAAMVGRTGGDMTAREDHTIAALGMILVYAVIIGFADNYVRVVAAEAGLWQFHATRSLLALPLIAGFAALMGHRLRPVSWRAVIVRSAIHGTAMVMYFGALAFLPVAIVAAGLFTAPIFVLLINGIMFGQRILPVQVVAVIAGFVGVILLLGPAAMQGASVAAILPVMAGALYAVGNIATRRWCAAESAETLLAGFFAALGIMGAAGLVVLWAAPVAAPVGADGFVLRGWVAPSGTFLFWVTVQAVGSVIGVGMMIRAYQLAPAARVSVMEYLILPASALWGFVLWHETMGVTAIAGMALIVAAGGLITFLPGRDLADQAPTAARQ
jgi:drug/metabolite transporter (DMT)-like permease